MRARIQAADAFPCTRVFLLCTAVVLSPRGMPRPRRPGPRAAGDAGGHDCGRAAWDRTERGCELTTLQLACNALGDRGAAAIAWALRPNVNPGAETTRRTGGRGQLKGREKRDERGEIARGKEMVGEGGRKKGLALTKDGR